MPVEKEQSIPLTDLLLGLETGSRPPGGASGLSSGIPSISGEHINSDGGFDFSKLKYVPPEFYSRMRRGHIRRGDILIVKDGATTGKVAFVSNEFPHEKAVVNEHVFLCRVDESKIDPEYLFLFLYSPLGQEMIRGSYSGTAIGGISQEFTDHVVVPTAAIHRQKAIVHLVHQKVAYLRQIQAARNQQISLALSFPKAILRSQFDAIPKLTVPFVKLGEVSSFLPARSLSNFGDTQVQIATTACLTEFGFNTKGIRLGRMRQSDMADCIISSGEVLVARSNTEEFVGRATLFDGEAPRIVAGDLTIRVSPDPLKLEPRFLSQYLSWLFVNSYWKDRAGGASGSMKKITRRQLSALSVPLPSLEQQHRSSERTRQQLRAIADGLALLRKNVGEISGLHSALLRAAFSGQL